MILYFLKTALCSAMLLATYLLLLKREKMYRFNRFYLLFSIVFSIAAPAVTITITTQASAVQAVKHFLPPASVESPQVPVQQTSALAPENSYASYCLPALYLLVTAFLLCRFTVNMMTIYRNIKNSKLVSYSSTKLVLITDPVVPHSFLAYIFLNKKEYEKGRIEKEVLLHELTHVKQKHSLDILFLELLLVFGWFHPALYLYRKAIRLNHEFLADEGVIKTFHDTPAYQLILLARASQSSNLLLTSRFNYSITKKRFIMMTKTISPRMIALKQVLLLPFIAVLACILCVKLSAQDTVAITPGQPQKKDTLATKPWMGVMLGSTEEGASAELLQEYAAIIEKYRKPGISWWNELYRDISPADKARMETIFQQMSKEQQGKQTVIFIKSAPPLPRIVPTTKQFESFKNPATYGVWINDEKVNNSKLGKYVNTDFAQVFISRLYGAARKHVSYTHQVNLMTKDYYQKYRDRQLSVRGNRLVLLYSKIQEQEDNRQGQQ